MSNPSIIITGANGFVGSSLVGHFHGLGWNVRAFVHSMPGQRLDGVTYKEFRLDTPPEHSDFINVQYLIHCAFQFRTQYSKNEPNITGTAYLITACRAAGTRFVFLSSFSAHPDAESNYGKIKSTCEKMCDATKDLILKPGLILGHSGLFWKMATHIQRSKFFPLLDGGRQPLQTILIHDLCRIIENGLMQNISGIFFVAEENALTYKNFVTELSNRLGRKPFFFNIPLRFLLAFYRICEKAGIRLELTADNILGLKHLKWIPTTKDVEVFGVRPRSAKESLARLINNT